MAARASGAAILGIWALVVAACSVPTSLISLDDRASVVEVAKIDRTEVIAPSSPSRAKGMRRPRRAPELALTKIAEPPPAPSSEFPEPQADADADAVPAGNTAPAPSSGEADGGPVLVATSI